jgi:predicted TIM-barrel fold metal-dependent hydrolase
MIIDAHSHYIPPEVAAQTAFFKVNWSDINRQLHVMDEQKIERALLVYPTSDAHIQMGGWDKLCSVYNQAIGSVVKKHRDRLIGAGILPVDRPALFKDELRRIQDIGLKVLSMASSYDTIYLNHEKFHPVFEFAQENNFPVHVHPQIINPIGEERISDPLLTPVLEYVFDVSVCIGKMMMEGTFLKYPNVKFIFAHYGGVLPLVKERFDNTYLMLRKRGFVKDLQQNPGQYFQNLFFDTSGSRSAASLYCALEVTDAKHICFGSDFPANQTLADSISVVETSALSDENKSSILASNLLSLL